MVLKLNNIERLKNRKTESQSRNTKLKNMIKRLLEKLNLIKPQKSKLVISDVISCSCDGGIIVCRACNGEISGFGMCAGCHGKGKVVCGKCGGKNKI